MPNGCPSLFLSAFPSILPSLLCFAQPHNKSSGLILHTAYAGQRHVPSFTGAGWETTVDTLCLTHIHALMTVPIYALFWGLCKKDFCIFFDWRTQNADVFLEHAHTITCLLTPTLQAWLQPHDASTKQRRYLLLYEQQREFFLSFFLLVKEEQHLGSIKPLMMTLYNQKTVFLDAKSQKAEILVLFFISIFFFAETFG